MEGDVDNRWHSIIFAVIFAVLAGITCAFGTAALRSFVLSRYCYTVGIFLSGRGGKMSDLSAQVRRIRSWLLESFCAVLETRRWPVGIIIDAT